MESYSKYLPRKTSNNRLCCVGKRQRERSDASPKTNPTTAAWSMAHCSSSPLPECAPRRRSSATCLGMLLAESSPSARHLPAQDTSIPTRPHTHAPQQTGASLAPCEISQSLLRSGSMTQAAATGALPPRSSYVQSKHCQFIHRSLFRPPSISCGSPPLWVWVSLQYYTSLLPYLLCPYMWCACGFWASDRALSR